MSAEVVTRRPGCCPCGAVATETDHIWPRYWGGWDHPDNLQRLCGTCNRRKGARVDLSTADPIFLSRAVYATSERVQKDMDKVGTKALALLRDSGGPNERLYLTLALGALRRAASSIEQTLAEIETRLEGGS